MRLYSAALDRTLLARAECVRAERPWMRRWRAAGERILALGMQFNAGHALNLANVAPVAALPGCAELHIGHSIVSDAVFVGMREATARMVRAMGGSRPVHSPG